MPNYVKNILRFEGEESRIEELLEFIKGEKSTFDFNRIIPMPEDLAIECSSKQSLSYEVYVALETGVAGEFLQLRYDNYCRKNQKISMEKFIDLLLKNATADLDLGKKAYNNLKNYGHKDWYGCYA